MKFTLTHSDLSNGIKTAQSAIDGRPQYPVLANVLLHVQNGSVTIAGTNLVSTISDTYDCVGESEDGIITLPGKILSEFVSKLPGKGEVTIKSDDEKVSCTVRCGRNSSKIKGIGADDYPPLVHNSTVSLSIPGPRIKDMINGVSYAASELQSNPILMGVYFSVGSNKVEMAASNRHRLAWEYIDSVVTWDKESPSNAIEVVIPSKFLNGVANRIQDNSAVHIGLPNVGNNPDSKITFFVDECAMTSQLLAGVFPKFKAAIPKDFTSEVYINRREVILAAQRAEIFARHNAYESVLSVDFPNDKENDETAEISIWGMGVDRGEGSGIAIGEMTGNPFKAKVNVKYIIDAMNAIKSEKVLIKAGVERIPGQSVGSVSIHPDGAENTLQLIMPMGKDEDI